MPSKHFVTTGTLFMAATLVPLLNNAKINMCEPKIANNGYYCAGNVAHDLPEREYGYTVYIAEKGGLKMPEAPYTQGQNIERLNSFGTLGENWNGYGAASLSRELIEKMRGIVVLAEFQPEIFPVASNSIQFEYEKDNGDYLQFKLRENGPVEVFRMNEKDEASFCTLNEIDMNEINRMVRAFYGFSTI